MITSIIQILAIFIVPILIMKYHNFFLSKLLGTIGTAYLLGILVAVAVYFINVLGLNVVLNTDVGEIGSHLAISIAIPLLLFSANLKEARKLSKKVLLSFASLVTSAVIVSAIAFYVYGKTIDNGGVLTAMAVGMYTGGAPNFNAIGKIFGLEATILGTAVLSDIVIGAVFYMFLLLLAKPLLSKILKSSDREVYIKESSDVENTDILDYEKFKITKRLTYTFLLAFGIAIIGAILGLLVWIIMGAVDGSMIDYLVPVIMITVTVLGIVASFNEKVRETKGMNIVGQYFILVFSFAIASSIDFTQMQGLFGSIIVLYGVITVGVFILHIIISMFLKADVDCTIVTLTAGIYGPAFIPAITNQIKNDDLTVPGLITGSIGYAIGTFLGLLLGLLFLI